MKPVQLKIPEIILLTPQIFADERGYFFESFNQKSFNQIVGKDIHFVQDNQSDSKQNVLRGLHYQKQSCQDKLVRVICGEIFDVAVDIRRDSPTCGQWVGEVLSAENRKQLWIPGGFAHGFLVLSKNATVIYKVSQYYAPQYEQTLAWDDKSVRINWPLPIGVLPVVSLKDSQGQGLQECLMEHG